MCPTITRGLLVFSPEINQLLAVNSKVLALVVKLMPRPNFNSLHYISKSNKIILHKMAYAIITVLQFRRLNWTLAKYSIFISFWNSSSNLSYFKFHRDHVLSWRAKKYVHSSFQTVKNVAVRLISKQCCCTLN